MTDVKKLRELAEKATSGPWQIDYQTPFGAGGAVCSRRNIHARTKDWEEIEIAKQPHMDKRNHEQAWANGRFIAAANPQAIIGLLDRLERYREALEHYESAMRFELEAKQRPLSEQVLEQAQTIATQRRVIEKLKEQREFLIDVSDASKDFRRIRRADFNAEIEAIEKGEA